MIGRILKLKFRDFDSDKKDNTEKQNIKKINKPKDSGFNYGNLDDFDNQSDEEGSSSSNYDWGSMEF